MTVKYLATGCGRQWYNCKKAGINKTPAAKYVQSCEHEILILMWIVNVLRLENYWRKSCVDTAIEKLEIWNIYKPSVTKKAKRI